MMGENMSNRIWKVKQYDKNIANELAQSGDFSGLLSVLLAGRGFKNFDDANDFIYSNDKFCDPFEFADMKKAVVRIEKAISDFEKIAIYGDYDADGITATALFYSYLCDRDADVMYFIPEREIEGYGLHDENLDKLKEYGISLLITVDNGISAINEVKYAKKLGIDVIITDHHTPLKTLPDALAVINPLREDCGSKFKFYSGVGVAFKLVQALENGELQHVLDQYADLVTLGTIADVVSLTGENRAISVIGIKNLLNSDRPGIKVLIDLAGLSGRKINSSNVAFNLIPRINAAGRVGSPVRAIKLLLTEDEGEAQEIAADIDNDNKYRQKIEQEILKQAEKLIENDKSLKNDRVIVVDGNNWHKGVIGIVATRLTEKYGKPCIVIAVDNDEGKGSGRSVEGFSLYEAISSCGHLLRRFGGHTLAAGLNIDSDKIEQFRTAINEYAKQNFLIMPNPVIYLDCKINPSFLTLQSIEDLNRLEPFGTDNPMPLFGLYNMKIDKIIAMAGGKHLKLQLKRDNKTVEVLKFSTTENDFPYKEGDYVDIAVTADKTEFRGAVQLSLIIKDIRPANFDEEGFFTGKAYYENLQRNEVIESSIINEIVPTREDLAFIYRIIKRSKNISSEFAYLYNKLNMMNNNKFNYCKFCLCFDILSEMKLIKYKGYGRYLRASIEKDSNKVDLNDSKILSELKKLN